MSYKESNIIEAEAVLSKLEQLIKNYPELVIEYPAERDIGIEGQHIVICDHIIAVYKISYGFFKIKKYKTVFVIYLTHHPASVEIYNHNYCELGKKIGQALNYEINLR